MYLRVKGNINLVLDWDKNFNLVSIMPVLKQNIGVEYMALIPKQLVGQILANSEDSMDFYIYSYYGEKEQYSLGIVGADRFVLFLQLIKLQQVGPKLACLISSNFNSLEEFYNVVQQNDIKTLSKIKGLGEKKASLIIWHFSREKGKELLKLINMQQDLDSILPGDEKILNKLLLALNSLGLSKMQAKTLLQNKKKKLQEKIKELQKNTDIDESSYIGDLLKIVLNKHD